jgi:signal peptidase I
MLVVAISLAATGCSKKRYKLPAGSMLPTFEIGSRVSADTRAKVPARGDVFVFKFPEHPEQSFVKRVVALPGEKIEVRGKVVTVNGVPLPTCDVGAWSYNDEGSVHPGDLVLEKNGSAAYLVFYETGLGPGADGAWTVEPGEYFVLGDNRYNSHDSRLWFGARGGGVPEANLIGRVDPPKLALPKGAESLAARLASCKKDLGVAP